MSRPLAQVAARTRSARLERGLRALQHRDVLTRFLDIYAVFDEPGKASLYGADLRARLAANGRPRPAEVVERLRSRAAARDPLAQMMYVDTRLWLPDDLLLVGDKMSMAESIEMRVPFLDRELVEFVESLPTDYKLRHGRRKLVHKRAMSGLLPRTIVHRKERGFATPVDRWLRGELHGFARELLLDGAGASARLFAPARMSELLERHRAGRADHTRQLFALVSFELWARRFLADPRGGVELALA
jgi:asparagine synthase (glutamine-hydrolysing)